MDVRELSRQQLDELKCREFDVLFPDDIPDEAVIEKCDGISFVDDDFFCTAGGKFNEDIQGKLSEA